MKAIQFSLFLSLLLVGCGEEETEFERTKRLAEGGDKVAQNDLGISYFLGLGVPQDFKEAVKWYRLAAEQGYAPAQNNLGVKYHHGRGVPQDYKEAVKWYTKSAEQGIASAQSNLGMMYDNGFGVPKDLVPAYAWFNIAQANGDEDAKEKRDELELTPEQVAKAQALSTEIQKRIEADRKD